MAAHWHAVTHPPLTNALVEKPEKYDHARSVYSAAATARRTPGRPRQFMASRRCSFTGEWVSNIQTSVRCRRVHAVFVRQSNRDGCGLATDQFIHPENRSAGNRRALS